MLQSLLSACIDTEMIFL